MYNKCKFNKVNDKKVLHKMKKQWVTVSVALLTLISGGVFTNHVIASANQNHINNAGPSYNKAKKSNPKLQSSNSNSMRDIQQGAQKVHNNILTHAMGANSNLSRRVNSAQVTVNGKPANNIKNPNQLRLYQAGKYKNFVFSRNRVPFGKLSLNKGVPLYQGPDLNSSKSLLRRKSNVRITKAFKQYGYRNVYDRYLIHMHHHNYYVSGGSRLVSFVAPSKHYRYYQSRINRILNGNDDHKFNKIRRTMKKFKHDHIVSYKRYMSLYTDAYNIQQSLLHPVVVKYHYVPSANDNSQNNSLVNSLESTVSSLETVISTFRNSSNVESSNLSATNYNLVASNSALNGGPSNLFNGIIGTSSYTASVDSSLASQSEADSIAQSTSNSINNVNNSFAIFAADSGLPLNNGASQSVAQSIDNSIANSYNNSVSFSVSVSNQNRANSAARSADRSIADSISNSVTNSVSALDQSLARSAAKSADDSIANSYNDSVSLSVSAANQSRADSAARSADRSIADLISNSVANSISALNQSLAQSAAQSADDSIANSYNNSVSLSVSAANQNLAGSVARSADRSIANSVSNSVANSISALNQSLAQSAAHSANDSIANSYNDSVSLSVSAANQSLASSAARSADRSIANSISNSVASSVSALDRSIAQSAAKSADDSIANSEANKNKSNSNQSLNSDVVVGTYCGLNYKYSPKDKSLEFTNGTANGDLQNFISNANADIKGAKQIKFDNDVNTSRTWNFNGMFQGDFNLNYLDLGNHFDTSNATEMFNMFYDDVGLQTLDFSHTNFNTANVRNMWGMFGNDYSLKSLNLGDAFNTGKVNNMIGMFGSDVSLSRLTLPAGFDTRNVRQMNNMFNRTNFIVFDNKSSHAVFNRSTNLSNAYFQELPNGNLNRNVVSLIDNNNHQGVFIKSNVAYMVLHPNQQMSRENPNLTNPIYSQNFHYNNPEGQSNDIEGIIPHYDSNHNVDYWDIYYLWNPENDLKDSKGRFLPTDQWGHVTTKDFTSFQPADPSDPLSIKNVAIPDPDYNVDGLQHVEVSPSDNTEIPWGQVAGGSVISNLKSDGQPWITQDQWGNPISPNARLAYFATYHSKVMANGEDLGNYLAYANPDHKGGYQQFHPYSSNDVFDSTTLGEPVNQDGRDPDVTYDRQANELVGYLAGGATGNIFEIASPDAVHWHLAGKINLFNVMRKIGPEDAVETPHLSVLNGQPIMFFSAQNGSEERYQGVDYTTGHFDNNGLFKLDANPKYGTIDGGFDNYAGDFANLDSNHLIYIGWLGNWYSFDGTHNSGFSLPRVLTWNGQQIQSVPVDPKTLAGNDKLLCQNDEFQDDGRLDCNFEHPLSSFTLQLSRQNGNGGTPEYITLSFNHGRISVGRDNSGVGEADMTNVWQTNRSSLTGVRFYVDNDSVEIYIPDLKQMYSMLDFSYTKNAPYMLSILPKGTRVVSHRFKGNN